MLGQFWEDCSLFMSMPIGSIFCIIFPIGLFLATLASWGDEKTLARHPLQLVYLWAVSYAIFWGWFALNALTALYGTYEWQMNWFVLATLLLLIGGPLVMIAAAKRAFACSSQQAGRFCTRWIFAVAFITLICAILIPNT